MPGISPAELPWAYPDSEGTCWRGWEAIPMIPRVWHRAGERCLGLEKRPESPRVLLPKQDVPPSQTQQPLWKEMEGLSRTPPMCGPLPSSCCLPLLCFCASPELPEGPGVATSGCSPQSWHGPARRQMEESAGKRTFLFVFTRLVLT